MADRCETLLIPEENAEGALRNALSVVAADGGQVGTIIVLVRPGCVPSLSWSTIDQADAAMAAVMVQMFAADLMRERLLEDD